MLKKLLLIATMGFLATLLAACSPRYDWRELEVADGRAKAAFPAKVTTETRDVTLAGHSLRFSLTAAQVDGAVFAVGFAPLPPEARADGARLAEALKQTLYRNLGAELPASMPADGAEFEARAQAKDVWLLARVWARPDAVIDIVASGSGKSLSAEHAREFVRSLSLHP